MSKEDRAYKRLERNLKALMEEQESLKSEEMQLELMIEGIEVKDRLKEIEQLVDKKELKEILADLAGYSKPKDL